MLDGLYEHTPWIVGQAMAQRPFKSLAHLKHTLTVVLDEAGDEAKKNLIRAHPELAGKAMVSNTLTAESTNEQQKAGLTQCSPEEFALIQKLNADYNAKFGWPFILAVRGPRGVGLTKQQIIATFQRRVHGHPDFELQECIRNIHRIAEIRLNDKFGFEPTLGQAVWDWQEQLARHTDSGYAELGQLTVTYLTDAHRACAQDIAGWMRDCGFDAWPLIPGQRGGRLQGQRPCRQDLAHRQPLRHRTQRRKIRWAAGHCGAHGLRARAAPPWATPAVWH